MASRGRSRLAIAMVEVLIFDWWQAADGAMQAPVVPPVRPLSCGEFEVIERAPRSMTVYELGFVEAVDCLGEGVVVAVAT